MSRRARVLRSGDLKSAEIMTDFIFVYSWSLPHLGLEWPQAALLRVKCFGDHCCPPGFCVCAVVFDEA